MSTDPAGGPALAAPRRARARQEAALRRMRRVDINHLLAKIDARDCARAGTFAYQRGLTLLRDSPAEDPRVVQAVRTERC